MPLINLDLGTEAVQALIPTSAVDVEQACFEYDASLESLATTLKSANDFFEAMVEGDQMLAIIKEHGVSAGFMKLANASGELTRICGLESMPVIDDANKGEIATMCVEGLGDRLKKAWQSVVAFFKRLWAAVSGFIVRLFSKNTALKYKIEQYKKASTDPKKELDTEKLGKIKIECYTKAQIEGFIRNATTLVSVINAAGENTKVEEFSAKVSECVADLGVEMVDGRKRRMDKGAQKAEKAKDAFWSVEELNSVTSSTLALLDSQKNIGAMQKKVQKTFEDGIKAAETMVSADQNAVTMATAKVAAYRAMLPAIADACMLLGGLCSLIGGQVALIAGKMPYKAKVEPKK